MSSRRNTSLVVALGVASLAATSLAAMVATSELLTESITHPLPEELDPPVPDLGRPGVIQVEPPERRRAKPSGGRSRAPATAPPPRRRSATRENGAAAAGDGGRAGVVAALQRRPARQRPVVFRTPAAEPSVDRTPSPRPPVARPAPRPVRPPQRPEHGSPPRSWRRGAGHKPHPGRHDLLESVEWHPARSCDALSRGRDPVDQRDRLAARLPGHWRVLTCVQAMDRDNAARGCCQGALTPQCRRIRGPTGRIDRNPLKLLVPGRGLEPPRCYSLVPETSASTNSATRAGCEERRKVRTAL